VILRYQDVHGEVRYDVIDTAHPGTRTVSSSVFEIAAHLWKGKDSSGSETGEQSTSKSAVERLEENPNTFSMVLLHQPRGVHGEFLRGTRPKLVDEIIKRRLRDICIDSEISPGKVQPDAPPMPDAPRTTPTKDVPPKTRTQAAPPKHATPIGNEKRGEIEKRDENEKRDGQDKHAEKRDNTSTEGINVNLFVEQVMRGEAMKRSDRNASTVEPGRLVSLELKTRGRLSAKQQLVHAVVLDVCNQATKSVHVVTKFGVVVKKTNKKGETRARRALLRDEYAVYPKNATAHNKELDDISQLLKRGEKPVGSLMTMEVTMQELLANAKKATQSTQIPSAATQSAENKRKDRTTQEETRKKKKK
jgi:hypothetical protein